MTVSGKPGFRGERDGLTSAGKEFAVFGSGIIETAILKDAYSYYKADLTENTIVPPVRELIDGKWVDYTDKLGEKLLNYDEIVRVSAETYVDPKHKDRYIANLSASYLIQQLAVGNSMPEYTCRIHASNIGWHFRKYVSYLSRNEDNGHIMVLNVAYDVSKQFEAEEKAALRLKHMQFKAEILELMLRGDLDRKAFIGTVLEKLRALTEADQVVYRSAWDRKIVVNSREMDELGDIPEDYCAMCPHSDIQSAVYRDGCSVMDDSKDGAQGVPVYGKCPVKSIMSRLLYHEGKAYGYLSIHYIRDYHKFTDYGRETFKQIAEFIQSVYSNYVYKEEHERALAAVSTMTEDFDYIAAVNQREKTVDRLRFSEKFAGVKKFIDGSLPGYERLDGLFNRIVHPDDMKMFREKSDFRICMAELEKHPNYKFEFRTLYEGKEEYYRIKFAYMPDNHDVVILGLLNIDEQVRREMETAVLQEKAEREDQLKEQMARVMELSDEIQAIYDVDIETGSYELFSYSNQYADSMLVKMANGPDFYADTINDVEQVVYSEDRDIIRNSFSNREYIKEMLAKQGGFSIDYRLNSENGPAWYRVKVVKKAEDESRFLTGVFYVDERIRKEAEYKRSIEDELKVINGLASDCVSLYTVDLEENSYKVYSITNEVDDIKSVVDSYSDLSKALRDYADGYVFEEDREKIYYYADLDNMRAALRNARSQKVTVRRSINGKWVWIEMNMIKVEPVNDPAKNVILAFTNHTQQVEQELEIRKELSDALSKAQEATEAKSNFLFNMSHDIRTPMNAITGFTNMAIKHIDRKDKVIDCLQKTQKAGTMLLSLINNVLEVSRIESGHAVIEEQPGDVYLSFVNIESTMRELAETKDIRLSFSFGDITDRYVYADFSRCMRIFLNIISNAVKYTKEGGYVKVTCEQAGKAENGTGIYRYRIEDNGIGMSEEFQKHVFDQFAREKSATISGIQGTGLGMSVVKSFVDLLGGDISVKSKKGVGTTFTVLLPFKLQDETLYTDPNSGEVVSSDGRGYADRKEISFLGKNVLLVEDNEMNREIATEILEEEEMVVESADDGTAAIEKLRERGIDFYDFILMDIQMPVMDGYQATKAIREMYPDRHIPIIALSANAFEEDRKKSMEAGMDDHVAKPVDVKKLKETLAKYL